MRQIHYTMRDRRCVTVTPSAVTDEEFMDMLYYVRRLMGYVIYPRWVATRLFLAETIEMTRRQGLFRQQVKRSVNVLLRVFDAFERTHTADFDPEFIELLSSALAGRVMGKMNELRGAIGAELMHHGVRRYVYYSYPYTLTELAYDNTQVFDKCMAAVRERYKTDFVPVFAPYRGDAVYAQAYTLMLHVINAVGESIPHISFDNTLSLAHLNAFERILGSDEVVQAAIREAYAELPPDKQKAMHATLGTWLDDDDQGEDKRQDLAAVLGEKYKVGELRR